MEVIFSESAISEVKTQRELYAQMTTYCDEIISTKKKPDRAMPRKPNLVISKLTQLSNEQQPLTHEQKVENMHEYLRSKIVFQQDVSPPDGNDDDSFTSRIRQQRNLIRTTGNLRNYMMISQMLEEYKMGWMNANNVAPYYILLQEIGFSEPYHKKLNKAREICTDAPNLLHVQINIGQFLKDKALIIDVVTRYRDFWCRQWLVR